MTEQDFRAAVRAAARGLPQDCPAGQGCGSCMETLLRILEEERRAATARAEGPDEAAPALREG